MWKRAQTAGVATDFVVDDVEGIDDEDANYEGLEVRQWHEHSLVTELYKIDVENKCRDQVKVEIEVTAANEGEPINCELPKTAFWNNILSNGISAKPVMALITKIDPSKPLGELELSVSAKRLRSTISGIGTGVVGSRVDPTYSKAYNDLVEQI